MSASPVLTSLEFQWQHDRAPGHGSNADVSREAPAMRHFHTSPLIWIMVAVVGVAIVVALVALSGGGGGGTGGY